MGDTKTPAALIGLVTIATVFVIGLHQLGGLPGLAIDWVDPIGWAERAAPEDVIGATLRYVGLAIGYWVLATTALYWASGLPRLAVRPRWVRVITVPFVRRVVDSALAATLAAAIVATPLGPALADETPLPPIIFEAETDGIPVPHVRLVEPAGTESSTTEPADSAADPTPLRLPAMRPIVPPVQTVETATADSVATTLLPTARVVAAGDNLWTIAADHLGRAMDHHPDETETARYWRLVIETNRPTLRSGDPNLIYPGEVIQLPALGATP